MTGLTSERLAEALRAQHRYERGMPLGKRWEHLTDDGKAHWLRKAQALLPVVEQEKAEAWDEGWEAYRRWQLVTNWAEDDLPPNPHYAALAEEGGRG